MPKGLLLPGGFVGIDLPPARIAFGAFAELYVRERGQPCPFISLDIPDEVSFFIFLYLFFSFL